MIRPRTKRKPSLLRPNARKSRNSDPRGLRYMEWVRLWPCLICQLTQAIIWIHGGNETFQNTPTECCHIGGNAAAKAPNMSCVPLCARHHREGPDCEEKLKRKFWEHHDLDYDVILAALHQEFEQYEASL